MGMKFTRAAIDSIQASIQSLSKLSLTDAERRWLSTSCPFLQPRYLDYLSQFRFRPDEEVHLEAIESGDPGANGLFDLNILVQGRWKDVILYEVPLMSIISQAYFEHVDTDWTLDGQEELAANKSKQLVHAGIFYSEFGSRRRRSYETHRIVLQGLIRGEREVRKSTSSSSDINGSTSIAKGKLLGTSNVHFAQMYNLAPLGTVAHEWTMAIAALEGYDGVNLTSLIKWDQVYAPPAFTPRAPAEDLTIALTDTFSTEVFWRDLMVPDGKGKEMLARWRGIRQDSGDSKAFTRRAKEAYERLGIDASKKIVLFSDGLTVDRCCELATYAKQVGIGAGFGVGTNLTNDFRKASDLKQGKKWDEAEKSKALNIVIKLYSLNGKPTVKISDELTKNTGDPDEVA